MTDKLKWWIGSNGNSFADGAVRRYCAAYEGVGIYRVTVDGFPIGTAASLEQAKAIAEAHNGR